MTAYKMLSWDFRGPEAAAIADHYRIHLEQYVETHQIQDTVAQTEEITGMYSVASLKVRESDGEKVEKDLRPHRVELI